VPVDWSTRDVSTYSTINFYLILTLPSSDKPKTLKQVYTDAVACDNHQVYLDTVREGDPRSYVIYHDKVLAFADRVFAKEEPDHAPSFTEFNRVPQELSDWVQDEFPKHDRPKTLVIYGLTRTGKTSWARSLVSTPLTTPFFSS
jgi:hypothetical protein